MTKTEWRPVPGFDGYLVSNDGRVWSMKRKTGRLIKTPPVSDGYLGFCARKKTVKVHLAVMRAFVGPPPEGMEVRHLDDDKTNNDLSNLVYGTRSENQLDRVRNGNHNFAFRTHCPKGHEYTEANTGRYRGQRRCKACQAAYQTKRRMERRRVA